MSISPAPQPRIDYPDFTRAAGDAYKALIALSKSVDDSGLEKPLTELVKLRASQLNGCTFCLRLHLNIACKLGMAEDKLDMVAAWREAPVFSPRERAALAWTEALTHLGPEGVSDAAYAALRQEFSETEALFLTVTVGTINQWNRIAVALRFAPPAAERRVAAA